MRVVLSKTKKGPKLSIRFEPHELTDNLYPQLFDYLQEHCGVTDFTKEIAIEKITEFAPIENLSTPTPTESKVFNPIVDVLAILGANANQLRKHKNEFKIKKGIFSATTINNVEGLISYAFRQNITKKTSAKMEKEKQINDFFTENDLLNLKNELGNQIVQNDQKASKKLDQTVTTLNQIDGLFKELEENTTNNSTKTLSSQTTQRQNALNKKKEIIAPIISEQSKRKINPQEHATDLLTTMLSQSSDTLTGIDSLQKEAEALQLSLTLIKVSSLLSRVKNIWTSSRSAKSAATHPTKSLLDSIKQEQLFIRFQVESMLENQEPLQQTKFNISEATQSLEQHQSSLQVIEKQEEEFQIKGLKKQINLDISHAYNKLTQLYEIFKKIDNDHSLLENNQAEKNIPALFSKLIKATRTCYQNISKNRASLNALVETLKLDNSDIIQLDKIYHEINQISLGIDLSIEEAQDIKKLTEMTIKLNQGVALFTQINKEPPSNHPEIIENQKTLESLIERVIILHHPSEQTEDCQVEIFEGEKQKVSPKAFNEATYKLDFRLDQNLGELAKIRDQLKQKNAATTKPSSDNSKEKKGFFKRGSQILKILRSPTKLFSKKALTQTTPNTEPPVSKTQTNPMTENYEPSAANKNEKAKREFFCQEIIARLKDPSKGDIKDELLYNFFGDILASNALVDPDKYDAPNDTFAAKQAARAAAKKMTEDTFKYEEKFTQQKRKYLIEILDEKTQTTLPDFENKITYQDWQINRNLFFASFDKQGTNPEVEQAITILDSYAELN